MKRPELSPPAGPSQMVDRPPKPIWSTIETGPEDEFTDFVRARQRSWLGFA